MARDVARDWMWSEACEMLARAERMHRELFRPAGSEARLPAWEPPVDILETEFEVLALVALPGVDAESAQAVIEDGDLVVTGTRVLPAELRTAVIHRLEFAQGGFHPRRGVARRRPPEPRVRPPKLRTAAIHRLELPQGRFYRRLRLPPGRYGAVRRAAAAGCLVITLQKVGNARG